MIGVVTLWGHALAALLFALLALMAARQRAGAGLPWSGVAIAAGVTALWALAVAGIDPRDPVTRIAEGVRNIAWLGLMFALGRRDGRIGASGLLYMVAATVTGAAMALAVGEAIADAAAIKPLLASTRHTLRAMVALAALYLVIQLWRDQGAGRRGNARLLLAALAAIWSTDIVLGIAAWIDPLWAASAVALRGMVIAGVALMLAAAATRAHDGEIRLSRPVTVQATLLAGLTGYGLAMAFATAVIGRIGGDHVRLLQTAFVFGSTAALITLVSTPWLRAWIKVVIAKHLFRHRYDYREEWLRCSETLGAADSEPLEQRVVRAIAELAEAPAGVLLLPDGDGLALATTWRWDGETGAVGSALASYLERSQRIVALDEARHGKDAAEIELPGWLVVSPDAWAIVPLLHLGRLAGAVVLARPLVERALDWEDFDILGVAGRQAASYLAEDRAHVALADAQRFEEFNRRFAFIIHDLKNLVSQHTLVARNAERHADNPAFRADMIATLRDSSERMTGLLARLSNAQQVKSEAPRVVVPHEIAGRIAAARRAQHVVTVSGDATATALADPAALETLLCHLVQNAIEASPSAAPIAITIGDAPGGIAIDVVDQGCGMTPAFMRDELFRPFASSKDGGFGIGAFEARKLAEAMGGRVSVESREGEGTRFRVVLPRASAFGTEFGEAA